MRSSPKDHADRRASTRSEEFEANERSEDTVLIATCLTDYPPPKGRYPLPPHRGLDTFNFGRMLSGQIEDYGTKQRIRVLSALKVASVLR